MLAIWVVRRRTCPLGSSNDRNPARLPRTARSLNVAFPPRTLIFPAAITFDASLTTRGAPPAFVPPGDDDGGAPDRVPDELGDEPTTGEGAGDGGGTLAPYSKAP